MTGTSPTSSLLLRRAREAAASVPDPEIPVLTIEDLGILRQVTLGADGTVLVEVTPTYSGCPATEAIRDDVERAVLAAGFGRVRVQVVPAVWTTDWLTERGRTALREYGIAPPPEPADRADPAEPSDVVDPAEPSDRGGPGNPSPPASRSPATRTVPLGLPVACPRCRSRHTGELARFGSTPCKALWVCRSCQEPFDLFKAH